MDFQNKPMWQGLGILFALSFIVLIAVTLLTPAESQETLSRFYRRCRPPGVWGPIRRLVQESGEVETSTGRLVFDSLLGIMACLGLVLATNAVFVGDWLRAAGGGAAAMVFGVWLVSRVFDIPSETDGT